MAKKKTKKPRRSTGPAYKSPEYMRQLGRRGGRAAAKKGVLSENAALSHLKNNPEAKRDGYHGGRKMQDGTVLNS